MYVTTFYSFKGGVGRTLALANVATYLVRRGRRVLLVDFDLEAPGLDTFEAFKPPRDAPGIVEYVSDYLASHQSPDVRDYSYKVQLKPRGENQASRSEVDLVGAELVKDEATPEPPAGEHLWIMPAGKRENSYSGLLQAIDWGTLYAEHNGYLLFEDLKEQWRQVFNPDYVLIDSRTGHTDVGGICTRQLPDAVVLLFFPNDQNLRGLEGVVADIREERKPPRNKHIELHFVMSNVPDLDDEDRILWRRVNKFRKLLEFRNLHVIHHYNSLSLLNQAIFCEERPRSRLAREYAQLGRLVVRNNLDDKEGVLGFLREQIQERITNLSPAEVRDRLSYIALKHRSDSEILTQLAMVYMQQGSHDEARHVLDSALKGTVKSSEVLLNRADSRLLLLNDRAGAASDAAEALSRVSIAARDVVRGIRILRQAEAEGALCRLAEMPGVRSSSPSTRNHFAHALRHTLEETYASIDLLNGVLTDAAADEGDLRYARSELAVSLIGAGEFERAMRTLRADEGTPLRELRIQDAFNYSMAEWAATGKPNPNSFQVVVALDQESGSELASANYAQCLAVAAWAAGDLDAARESLKRALSLAGPGWEFSCWRYLDVSAETFVQDVYAIRDMIDAGRGLPEFMRDRRHCLGLQ